MTETRVARHVLFQFIAPFFFSFVSSYNSKIIFCVGCTCSSHKIISRTPRPIKSDGTLCDKGTCTIVIMIEMNAPFYLVPLFFLSIKRT